jgi:putative MATE family efflux protein
MTTRPGMAGGQARARLIDGSVERTLARLAVPLLLGVVATTALGVVDAYFVGKLDALSLSALAFTFPVNMVMTNLAMGLGVGTAAVVARVLGQGDSEAAHRLAQHSLWLALALSAVLTGLGLLTVEPLARALGATGAAESLFCAYMRIWYGGMVSVIVPAVGGSALRASGDTRTPALVTAGATALHCALDPLLILGWAAWPGLGLAGAAWASVIARGLAAVAFLVILRRQGMFAGAALPRLAALVRSGRQIGHIALPVTATRIVFPISMMLLTRLVSHHGPAAVAGLGVGGRIDNLIMIPVAALSGALVPFVGQNWGAGRRDRVWQGLRWSMIAGMLWGLIASLVLWAAAPWIAARFDAEGPAAAATASYLRIMSLSFGLQGVTAVVSASLQAVGRPLQSAVLTLARMFALYLPLSWAGSLLWGLPGLFAGGSLATAVIGLAALLWGTRAFRQA